MTVPDVVRLLDRSYERKPIGARIVHDLQRQVRLDAAQVTELCRRYQAGESVTSLKQVFTINRETVLLHLKRADVTRPPNLRKPGDDEFSLGFFGTPTACHSGAQPRSSE